MKEGSKKHTGRKPVTVWLEPHVEMVSQYGHVTYEVWCQHEAVRMNARGDEVKVRKEFGEVCVSR